MDSVSNSDEFDALLEPDGVSANVTTDSLAQLFGVTPRTVTDLGRRGILKQAGRGRWPMADAVRAYISHLREQAAGRGASGTLTTERIRVAKEQADKLAMGNAVSRGEMVPASEVEFAWAAVLRDVRGAFLALPSRIQQRLPHLSTDDIAQVDREIRDALTEAAQ